MTQKISGPDDHSILARMNSSMKISDRKSARSRLKDIRQELPAKSPYRILLDQKPVTDFVLGIADHSPYLFSILRRSPERALGFLSRDPDRVFDEYIGEARRECAATDDEQEVMRILRQLKQDIHFLVAAADIAGLWDVVTVTQRISAFADCAVSCALAFLLRQQAVAGKLRLHDAADPEKECGVVVLALGKHGARELNYSSDIDLVVFYDPQTKVMMGDAEPSQVYVRITRSIVKLLQERTGDGYVLRVDLRLRPDPGSTAVAISLPAAFDYYETLGQNWERAAFIKARPVAGDLPLGEKFIADLAPFIWRRYFDYAAISDIHAMKRQIHAVRGHAEIAVAGHDVKLGRGGIREVEFFVQTQQLVFGGRRPQLRGAQTLAMLAELQRDGWVGQDAVDDLSAAYKYLRTIEHRLQMINDEQTQRLPADADQLERFARFCGYASAAKFGTAIVAQFTAVEKHYARLFEHAPGLDSSIGSLVFTGTSDDPETIDTLRTLGFLEPSIAIETIRGWHFGRRSAVQSARAREVLTELVPALIETFSNSGDPDAALAAFDLALGKMPAAVELLSILKSNKMMLELFSDILGGAPRLAEVIARRPHVLDAAIDPGLWQKASRTQEAESRLSRLNDSFSSMEDFLDGVRDIYQEEAFLIGVRLLSGQSTPLESGHAYSDLATAIVGSTFKAVLQQFSVDHGFVPDGRCAVFGLGKLGSREMTATSDLDLVFLYDYSDEAPQSNGSRPLHAAQYYARLAQRLISALSVSTRRGGLYEVDMRLRPSGKQGPVATRLSSFREYQLNEAETWEHMALTRARPVAGDASLSSEAMKIIADVLQRVRKPAQLAADVFSMRRLIAQEKGEDNPWDIKLASGGILDIEFLIQYLILRFDHELPTLAPSVFENPAYVFHKAASAKKISASAAELLSRAYAYFGALTQMTRLSSAEGFDPQSAAKGVLRRLATAVNLPDFSRVEAELDAMRREVRAIFNATLGQS